MKNSGLDVAFAAEHILAGHTGTLDQAADQLSHLSCKDINEWRTAVAYLACQVWAYRKKSNEDASLALAQIQATLDGYKRAEERKASV